MSTIAETDLAQSNATAGERDQGTATNLAPSPAPLNTAELQELGFCEDNIARGLKTFILVGISLLSIREHKLYRAEYGSFEQYLLERWDMSVRHGQRLMNGADIAQNLLSRRGTGLILPASESQVRPLAGLTPDEQALAWDEAIRTAPHGRVTGRHVAHVVARRQGQPLTGRRRGNETLTSPLSQDQSTGPTLDPSAGRGTDPARHHAPGRPAFPRDERIKQAADRVVDDMRELLELMGAADSAAGADLNIALETVQRFQGHLERIDQLHAARAA